MGRILGTTRCNFSIFMQVKRPVNGTLMAPPMCYTPSPFNAGKCDVYYPTFNSTTDDAILGYCGMARINPAHVMDMDSCVASPGTSLLSCKNYLGQLQAVPTDMYLYVTSAQDSQVSFIYHGLT